MAQLSRSCEILHITVYHAAHLIHILLLTWLRGGQAVWHSESSLSAVVVQLAVPHLGAYAGMSREGIESFYAQH
ncbi:hypothetical protein TRIATDRAFT_159622 [Trichoderma atroviride IMI 206040]|uniref:Uncharacterized protein n=1 Tax=Hypocrea atroviridis (strain ATCC 20476 / IMI 206040) TaxID=452589 RepID=G9NSY2_HYPAI|nr:uncharacterized protein TRIATDRAFT_159622 [Trichoderma atroviride IMI 206040]EHK46526.1 hypothetical protein TRIATDRAFT_159622 [Trichoderma atroviride IMI 206040]